MGSITDIIVLGVACAAAWYFRAPIIAFIKKTFGAE